MEKVYDIAVIGAGPGGIGTAVEAAKAGLSVVLFEKTDKHSATLREYYKDGKRVDKDYKGQKVDLKGHIPLVDGTKETTLELFDKVLEGIEFHTSTEVEKVVKVGDVFVISSGKGETKAHACAIAIGKMGKPNKPSYSLPMSLRARTHFNAQSCTKNENLLIVGGGNSAVEYAIALCEDNKVTLNYRKAVFTRINETNQQELDKCVSAGKITLKAGIDITALADDGGLPQAQFTDGSTGTFDRVVYAIGGIAPVDFLHKCGITLDDNKVPVTDANHQSNIAGLYIAGDLLYKNGGSIGFSLNHGFEIVQDVRKALGK